MSSSKPTKTSTGADEASSLQTLLALSVDERRKAVAKDVRRRVPQFSTISAHDLADALDVTEHWRPGNEWSFTRCAPIFSVEEHARYPLESIHVPTLVVSARDDGFGQPHRGCQVPRLRPRRPSAGGP